MTELAKTFLAHPYAVLGASTRETLKELEERRRETVLFGDEKTAERAFEALIHPASRLAEELHWFPGMSREDTERWVRFAASGAPGDTAPAFQGSSFLARFQTIRICLDKLPLDSPFDWMTTAKSLLLASRWLLPGQVMEEINRDRRAAGFTAVNSVKTVEAELDALFQECAGQLLEKTENVPGEMNMENVKAELKRCFENKKDSLYHTRMIMSVINKISSLPRKT